MVSIDGRLKRVILPGENTSEARARWKIERQLEIVEQREMEKTRLGKELQTEDERRIRLGIALRVPLPPPIIMPPPIYYTPGDKKLSILICSIISRKPKLNILLETLRNQAINNKDDVEILLEVDNKVITIGAKRNRLLKRAVGDYICFVDDDDKVSPDYIAKILKAIKSNPDCCSLKGQLSRKIIQRTSRRRGQCRDAIRRRHVLQVNMFIHSLKYKKWFERKGVYYRCPNHLNVVKRMLAYQVGFPEVSQGEDSAYSTKLLTFLKTETAIPGIIYFYEK